PVCGECQREPAKDRGCAASSRAPQSPSSAPSVANCRGWAAAIRDVDATLKSSGPDTPERGSPQTPRSFRSDRARERHASPPAWRSSSFLYHSKGHWFTSDLAESPVLLHATTRGSPD